VRWSACTARSKIKHKGEGLDMSNLATDVPIND
jgi:hypothetical protein